MKSASRVLNQSPLGMTLVEPALRVGGGKREPVSTCMSSLFWLPTLNSPVDVVRLLDSSDNDAHLLGADVDAAEVLEVSHVLGGDLHGNEDVGSIYCASGCNTTVCQSLLTLVKEGTATL